MSSLAITLPEGLSPNLNLLLPEFIVLGTALGAIMGTASYMSPEQARGKIVDKRTDIWAFGCCLYESLTGKKAFEEAKR